MAQMTESLARAILAGNGCTRWELEQLCHFWLKHHGESATTRAEGEVMLPVTHEWAKAGMLHTGTQTQNGVSPEMRDANAVSTTPTERTTQRGGDACCAVAGTYACKCGRFAAEGAPAGLTSKEAWWAGARAGLGLAADTPRTVVADHLRAREAQAQEGMVLVGEVHMPLLRRDGATEVGDERVTFTDAFIERLAKAAPAAVTIYAAAPTATEGSSHE